MKASELTGHFGLYYYRYPNFGDMLNEFLPARLFHLRAEQQSFERTGMFGIGSILDRLLDHGVLGKKDRELQKNALQNVPVHIWGSGLLYPYEAGSQKLIRPIVAHALRGEYTRKQLSEIQGSEISCVLGDPGLLASKAVPAGSRIWKVGIIPHHKETDHPLFHAMEMQLKDAVLIDAHDDPETVLREISQCECIISSSLHGLIVADSYGIPNCWCRLPDDTLGNSEYKYHDYFSAFGTDREPFILGEKHFPDPGKDCRLSYRSRGELRRKQRELLKAFPY